MGRRAPRRRVKSSRLVAPMHRRCGSMRWNVLGALMLSLCLTSQGFAAGLLDRMLGSGCGCDACEPSCCCEKSCGCCSDPCCDDGCCEASCGCPDDCCCDTCCGDS